MSMEKNWSVQQKAIFDFFRQGKGNLVVRARAGTGKTTTIIEACKYAPASEKILLAAFNKKIATELQQRVGADNVEAKTLHALGFAYVRRQWQNVKVDAAVDFDRASAALGPSAPDDMVGLVKKLAGLLKNVAPFTKDPEEAEEIAEQFDIVPDTEWEEEGWTTFRIAKAAIVARDAAKERDGEGRISFDDMVFVPIACGFVRAWYTMVVIDEAQDMNLVQLLLAQKACKRGGRIIVVGDDRQAIYGFRGADADGIDRLKRELEAKELGLTITYRCGKKIVAVANRLVPDFLAAEGNPDGAVDSFGGFDKLYDEAAPGDFVLSRANAPLMAICLALLKRGKRARIEGRDVAAGLRIIVKGFKARSVPQFIERVGGWADKQKARTAKLKNVEAREAKAGMIADQAEMLVAMAEGCASVDEILSRTDTLFGDSDGPSPKDAIVCSSVHRTKGLEADRVFVLADTVSERGREEKNITYVAVTRAKARLIWVRR
jgi:superfamily I DNA/RNA helicase